MAHAKHRLDNPIATATGTAHGPLRPLGAAGSAGQNEAPSWSGLIEAYTNPYFAANGSGVQIFTTVPSVGTENCSYGPYKTWIWAGMDGSGLASAGNLDVLQAGVAAEACTNNNPPTPPYYVWYEWFTQGCEYPNAPPVKRPA